jgi:type I restriction enzyme S subunit
MSRLPPGWVWTTLGETVRWGSGGTPRRSVARYYGGSIPWAVIGDLHDGLVTTTAGTITEEGLAESSARLVSPGTVLIATYGSIGKLGIAGIELATNQAIAFADPKQGLDSRFLFWYLRAERRNLAHAGKGATQKNISQTVLRSWPLPLPPLNEQRRIVAAIEEHLSRLDAADASLAAALRRLDALASQTVAQALSGDWATVPLSEVTESQVYGTSAKASTEPDGVPVLRMGNINGGKLDLTNLKYLPAKHPDVLKLTLEPGDVLFNRTNSPELVGKSAVFTADKRMTFASYLIRVRLTERCDPHWAALVINGPPGRRYVASVRSQQVGQANVNGSKLAALPLPLPPLEEQRRIVAEVEERLSQIDALRASIERAQRRSRALRAAILERAFRGELVPQDPSDEPAEALLARIRAQRETATVRAGRGRKRG